MTPAKHPPWLVIYQDHAGRWRWHAVSRNGHLIDASEQGYRSRRWALHKARRSYPEGVLRP